jgi:hypothetical protein
LRAAVPAKVLTAAAMRTLVWKELTPRTACSTLPITADSARAEMPLNQRASLSARSPT